MPNGGRTPREALEEAARALRTPGARVCLQGILASTTYHEGEEWQRHRYLLLHPSPEFGGALGLPRFVFLRPGNQIADDALNRMRLELGDREIYFCGVTSNYTVRSEGQDWPMVVVHERPSTVPLTTPVPAPAPFPTPTPTPAPAPSLTQQWVDYLNALLRQYGIPMQVTPENVRDVIDWVRENLGIDIQMESRRPGSHPRYMNHGPALPVPSIAPVHMAQRSRPRGSKGGVPVYYPWLPPWMMQGSWGKPNPQPSYWTANGTAPAPPPIYWPANGTPPFMPPGPPPGTLPPVPDPSGFPPWLFPQNGAPAWPPPIGMPPSPPPPV